MLLYSMLDLKLGVFEIAPPYQVSVACRDIAPGEEVTDCYGLPWYNVAKEKRNQIQNK